MRTKLFFSFMIIGLLFVLPGCDKQQVERDLRTTATTPTADIVPDKLAPKEVLAEPGDDESKEVPEFSELTKVEAKEIAINPELAKDRTYSYNNYGHGYNYHEIYSYDYHLHQGYWLSLHLKKHQLSPHHRYIAVVKPYHGDANISAHSYYIHNHYTYSREHRASRRSGHQLDETWLHYRDIGHHESHGAFYIYAQTYTHFRVTIYQVPDHTIWVRHNSYHYGNQHIQFRYKDCNYNLYSGHAAAIPYNHAYNPYFYIWECKTPATQQNYCYWDGAYSGHSNKYMYDVYDCNNGYAGDLDCRYHDY